MNVLTVHGPQMRLDREAVVSILVTVREDYNGDIRATGESGIPCESEAELVFRWLRDSLPSGTFDALARGMSLHGRTSRPSQAEG